MYIKFITWYYDLLMSLVYYLPSVSDFNVPSGVYTGIDNIMSLVGWIMPYNLYSPLIAFILALTVFRIAWAVFITFKR